MLRKAQGYPRSNPRRQHSVCLHVLPRQRCCEQYEESIDDFALVLERNNSVPEGSGKRRGDDGSHKDERGNEECAHCEGAQAGLVRTWEAER